MAAKEMQHGWTKDRNGSTYRRAVTLAALRLRTRHGCLQRSLLYGPCESGPLSCARDNQIKGTEPVHNLSNDGFTNLLGAQNWPTGLLVMALSLVLDMSCTTVLSARRLVSRNDHGSVQFRGAPSSRQISAMERTSAIR